MQEMVRAFYFGWYDAFVTGQPTFERGWLTPAARPGHGVEIRPEARTGLAIRESVAA